ncbi:MAG TPA: LemA family protein [Candidatus Binatia bacterium]|nr:LemA family protein [Candidatus Binatia bacterium]
MWNRRTLLTMMAAALASVLTLPGCGYNTLVKQNEAVDGAWSEVQNQLQRRNDLIPNLVNTVKGFAQQEKDVLIKVTEARSRVAGAGTPEETMKASNELSGALSRLLVLVEQYPQLKSDQNFLRLQDELAGTENRLSVARMRYNEQVQAYNSQVKSFPTVLVAKMTGFGPRPYFEAPESAQAVPQVKF